MEALKHFKKVPVLLMSVAILAACSTQTTTQTTTTTTAAQTTTAVKVDEAKEKLLVELTKKGEELVSKLTSLKVTTDAGKLVQTQYSDTLQLLKNLKETELLQQFVSKLEENFKEIEETLTKGLPVSEKLVYVPKYVDRPVEKVVTKVVEKVVPKEVIKEVPKEVIKEVPKEVVKEVIKEVPKEVIVEKEPIDKLSLAIDNELLTKVDAIMNQWVADKYIPGGTVLIAKDGKIVAQGAYGNQMIANFDPTSPYDKPNYVPLANPVPTRLDTLYDLASVTKIMSTTQAIMKLVSEKRLDLNAKVSRYIPGFEANGKGDVTVKSLLTHTSGLPQWEPTYFYGTTKAQQLNFIKNVALNPAFVADGVGNKWHHYSDLGFMTLGYIVEAITGQSLDQYVLNNIYRPLSLGKTLYNPKTRFGVDNIAATSMGNPYEYKMVDEENYPNVGYDTTVHAEAFKKFTGWRKRVLRGEVNDGNAGMATAGVAGHAGLFSTVGDLAVLTQLMLNGGEYGGVRIYDKSVIDLFTSKQTNTGKISEEFGYGFKLDQSWMGDTATEKVYGHDGFTGTYFVNDPDHKLTVIVLTNKMQSGFRSGLLPNGRPQNTNLYWNMASMVRQISNTARTHFNIK